MSALPRAAQAYIVATAALAVWLWLGQPVNLNGPRLWLFVAANALAAITQIYQVRGLIPNSFYNASAVAYSLPLLALGRAECAWVVVLSHVVAWARSKAKIPWFAQVFNAASLIIPLSAADLVFTEVTAGRGYAGLAGLLSIVAAAGTFITLNHLMVGLIHYLVEGKNFAEAGVFGLVLLTADATLFGMGAATALIWEHYPYAAILALVPLYFMHLTLRLPALERQKDTDAKTGLYNVRYFSRALERELARSARYHHPLTVVMADLDNLRAINNTYGHLAGDTVLIGVSTILQRSVRAYDVVARFGGEEFAIIMPEVTPEDAAAHVDGLRAAIEAAEHTVDVGGQRLRVTMSFGLAGRELPGQTADEIIHSADLAVYHSKAAGRNCVSLNNASAGLRVWSTSARAGAHITGSPGSPAG